MVNPLKLPWKYFIRDLVLDPGLTLRRAMSICAQGTSLKKFHAIRKAIFDPASDYGIKYHDELEYLKSLPSDELDVFPYPSARPPATIPVEFDAGKGMHFIRHKDRRLYFPSSMSTGDCENCYRSLLEGEDIFGGGRIKSPHCYQDESHRVRHGDIVLDVGSAEGLFALDVADIAGRIYLFEQLPRWGRPLAATFEPFADKTVLVNKLVSDRTTGNSVRLSDAISDVGDQTYFLKMDIEGWERTVLESSVDFLQRHRVKISCCAYHRQHDAEQLTELLEKLGYRTRFSDGYMLPPINEIEPPYFRKGVIYAQNF